MLVMGLSSCAPDTLIVRPRPTRPFAWPLPGSQAPSGRPLQPSRTTRTVSSGKAFSVRPRVVDHDVEAADLLYDLTGQAFEVVGI